MAAKKINSALLSVYYKDGLAPIVKELTRLGVTIYSTGGTQRFIEEHGGKVISVEELTGFPSILDGRVKTLHPTIYGGLLARREEDHLAQLRDRNMPEIDLVVVDLYPFEETVANTDDEREIIEKIDIGGITLIRAAAKNYRDVVCVSSRNDYDTLLEILQNRNGETTLAERKRLARRGFATSSHYDAKIHEYFLGGDEQNDEPVFKQSEHRSTTLRYGENPHQQGIFYGDFEAVFEKLNGKAISYNNLVDIDAAVGIMEEFKDGDPAFCILKHTNACGVAVRDTQVEAWRAALAGDPTSAFGGILITNRPVDLETAQEIDRLFYEVLIAPGFEEDAFEFLSKKSKRILLKMKGFTPSAKIYKSILNGTIEQDADLQTDAPEDLTVVTRRQPTDREIADLIFAGKIAKHLKSNTIVFARDNQLLGMGCGQTSRVDACKQAIAKAENFGFDLKGSAVASDAFFPFPDCVELAAEAGATAIIQPGGSIKDKLSIEAADQRGMAMVMTGRRHFKH